MKADEDSILQQIKNLSDKNQEEVLSNLEDKEDEIYVEIKQRHIETIENQLDKDSAELEDFNIVVSSFDGQHSTHYSFIRVEPLVHDDKPNFDILIGSFENDNIALIECERTLMSGLESKLSDFVKERKLWEEETDFDEEEYLSQFFDSADVSKDFIIASGSVSEEKMNNKAQDLDENFLSWSLTLRGQEARIHQHIAKKERTADFGYSDEDLENYVRSVLNEGVNYSQVIDFIYTSSKYKKLVETARTMKIRGEAEGEPYFTFESWERTNDESLSNMTEDEKKALFYKIVDYGLKTGVLAKAVDNGNRFENEFRVKTRASKDPQKLKDEVVEKMAKFEMKEDFEERMKQEAKQEAQEVGYGGRTLEDFTNAE